MYKISVATFNSLMHSLDIQTGNDLECVGFKSDLGSTSISFYGRIENGYKLEWEDFGRMKGGKWVQTKPTKSQRAAMQKEILDAVKDIEDRKASEEQSARDWEKEIKTFGYPGSIYGKLY